MAYNWRHISNEQREDVLRVRKLRSHPWHSPPHRASEDTERYMVSAACFEHQPVIGHSPARMAEFEEELLRVCSEHVLADPELGVQPSGCQDPEHAGAWTPNPGIYAWCVLPNHYHILVHCRRILAFKDAIGQMHGRLSYYWNGEEGRRGRKVWFNCQERAMKSDRHFWATLNYIHHNPVHHRYTERWQDWPFASAAAFLDAVGRGQAERIWREYPIRDYGKKWDPR